jgi:hypothetical protein
MKSFEELSREQATRESSLLSSLDEAELEKVAGFEGELGQQREEILFKITTAIEDTKNALEQVEQLAQRLRKHLDKLNKIQQVLSK